MSIKGDSYSFTDANIDRAPDSPGVYQLSENGTVIYIGMSKRSIQTRLRAHKAGSEGACTKKATTYKRETTTAERAETYEAELLTEYKKLHSGKLPSCNKLAS